MSGEGRDTVYVKVPVGTQIYLEDGETMLADLTKEGVEVRLLKAETAARAMRVLKPQPTRRRVKPLLASRVKKNYFTCA